jgi:trk system potassium uptake protein TrkH
LNYFLVLRKLGVLILLAAAFMATSLVWAFLDRNTDGQQNVIRAFFISVGICLLIGSLLLWRSKNAKGDLYRKEAVAIVGLSWLVLGLLGALPYIFSGVLHGQYSGWMNIGSAAIFESVSGFTTTGASIFVDPEGLPRAILFWRSLTHWLGGMGIVVLFVAILGSTGTAGKYLVASEITGPQSEAVRPRIRQTALLLWKIYLTFSAAEFILLSVQGMNYFDSLCHTFGTLATGGFSTKNASINYYNSFGIELTIIVFMLLAGINFNLYAALLQGRWRNVLRNRELRLFLIIIVAVTLMIGLDLKFNRSGYSIAGALRSAGFQVVSIITTTGYGTDDFNQWPTLSRWLLIVLMFIGGSAGSTAGGIKLIRLIIFVKIALHEIERTFRPHVVRPLRVSGKTIDEDVRRNISAYVGHIFIIFFTSTILLLLIQNESVVAPDAQLDLESAFTAVIATLNNIGPGLNMVGATENFAFFNAPAKLFLSLLMILGRLEIMVLLCLFIPSFWRRD